MDMVMYREIMYSSESFYNLWKLLETSPLPLLIRRVGLVDIEQIAPLEEGALPYNLAEVQRQVQHMKTCWCVWFPLPQGQLFFASQYILWG